MGFSLSYIAVRTADPKSVLDKLNLQGTGEYEEIPESPFLGADLRNGWYLVLANDCECELFREKFMSALSIDFEVLTCMAEEHCMHSAATGWQHGKQLWSVYHAGDGDDNKTNLQCNGDLPSVFPHVEKKIRIMQEDGHDDVDYVFEIPKEIFREITGFTYDQYIEGLDDKPFEILVRK